MKKYVKPELFYEHYELSQHIADCAWELTNSTEQTCAAVADPDFLPDHPNLFASAAYGCVFIPKKYEGGNYENFCYTGGAAGVNVFAS